MEKLSAEGRNIHEFVKAAVTDDLEQRLKVHSDDLLKSMTKLLQESTKTLDGLITACVDGVRSELHLDIEQIRSDLELVDIEQVDYEARPGSSSAGREVRTQNIYVPPPARGARDLSSPREFQSPRELVVLDQGEQHNSGPRVELSRFDGPNPRLWQARCEDYFKLWGTHHSRWISYATAQFEGAAARWLESVQR